MPTWLTPSKVHLRHLNSNIWWLNRALHLSRIMVGSTMAMTWSENKHKVPMTRNRRQMNQKRAAIGITRALCTIAVITEVWVLAADNLWDQSSATTAMRWAISPEDVHSHQTEIEIGPVVLVVKVRVQVLVDTIPASEEDDQGRSMHVRIKVRKAII